MPQFTIELPDGRKMRTEAANEADALAGAQAWYAASAPAAEEPVSEAAGARAAAGLQSYKPEPTLAELYPSGSPVELPPGTDAPVADFAQKVAQGVFANYADEIGATAGALPNILTGGYVGRSRKEILDEIRGREKQFEKEHPAAAAVGEIGGAVGAGVAGGAGLGRLLGYTPGFVGSVLRGGAAAAPMGAVDATGRIEGPATVGDYAGEAVKGGVTAGLTGAAVGGLGNIAGNMIGPIATDAARRLDARNIRLTPGEVVGPHGAIGRMENTLASVPLIGDMVRARAREGVEDLNREAYRTTLEPLGQRYIQQFNRLAPNVGNESVDEVSDILGRRYDRVVPRMQAVVDQPLEAEVRRIASTLPQAVVPEYRDAVERLIDRVMDTQTGHIPGERLQQSLRSLRDTADRLRRSTASPYHPELGDALNATRDALEANMARHSAPADVTRFGNVNRAWARYTRLRDASSRVGSDEGVFSPANLHSAVRAQDRSVGKGNTARGRALMQDLSGPARSTMKAKGAGSPTAERLGLIGLVTQPMLAAKMAAYGVPLAMLYSRPGSRAFQRLAMSAAAPRTAARQAIQSAGTVIAPAVGYETERTMMDDQ